MKSSIIFVPATLVQQHSSVLCNFSCLDNLVDWDSYLFGEGSYGVATLPLGLFIFSRLATPYNEFSHRNHATAPTPTRQVPAHTTPAPSSQAQQPHPKSQLFDNAFGKVLSFAAIGLAVLSTLIFN